MANYDSREEPKPVIVFLGVDEDGALSGKVAEGTEEFVWKAFAGAPYFAVDVTPRGKGAVAAAELIKTVEARGYAFHDNSPRHMGLHGGQGEFFSPLSGVIHS